MLLKVSSENGSHFLDFSVLDDLRILTWSNGVKYHHKVLFLQNNLASLTELFLPIFLSIT